jgi:hypothetical protein
LGEAILIVNTDGSSVPVPASDTILQSAQLKPTQYNNVRIATDIQITTSSTAAANALTFKLKLTNPATAATTTITTWNYKTVLNTAGIFNQHFELITDDRIPTGNSVATGGLLSLTVVGAGADAQTSVVCLNLYAHSID